MKSVLYAILLSTLTAGGTKGFAFSPSTSSPLALSPVLSAGIAGCRDAAVGNIFRLRASKEEEIAALEEKLRRLREDAPREVEEENAAAADSAAPNENYVIEEDEEGERSYAVGKPTKKSAIGAASKMMGERRGPNDVDPFYSEMMSESWKEGDALQSGDGGGIMGAVIPAFGAIAALVVLGLFSQVPVGQEDLSKYSTVGAAPSTRIDLGDKNPVKSVKDTVYTGE